MGWRAHLLTLFFLIHYTVLFILKHKTKKLEYRCSKTLPQWCPCVWNSVIATAASPLGMANCPWECQCSGDTSRSHSKPWIATFPNSPTPPYTHTHTAVHFSFALLVFYTEFWMPDSTFLSYYFLDFSLHIKLNDQKIIIVLLYFYFVMSFYSHYHCAC